MALAVFRSVFRFFCLVFCRVYGYMFIFISSHIMSLRSMLTVDWLSPFLFRYSNPKKDCPSEISFITPSPSLPPEDCPSQRSFIKLEHLLRRPSVLWNGRSGRHREWQ